MISHFFIDRPIFATVLSVLPSTAAGLPVGSTAGTSSAATSPDASRRSLQADTARARARVAATRGIVILMSCSWKGCGARPVAGNAAHADEGTRNDAYPHMRFAVSVHAGLVAGMQMAFIDDDQAFGGEGRNEFCFDTALKRHGLAPFVWLFRDARS